MSDYVENLLAAVKTGLEDIKALDITVMDVSKKTSICDYMVVASGTSSRHLKAIVNSVAKDVKDKGFVAKSKEGEGSNEWVLIDFGDIVVHCMTAESRAYYDLERLWQGERPSGVEED